MPQVLEARQDQERVVEERPLTRAEVERRELEVFYKEKVRREAERLLDEDRMENLLRTAGAERVSDEARRAFKAMAEEVLADWAERVIREARERGEREITAKTIARAMLRTERPY